MKNLKSLIIKLAFVVALMVAVANSADAVHAAANIPAGPGDTSTQLGIREFYREWYEDNRELYCFEYFC